MDEYTNSDYLQHYGVKGMKWGVRRAEKKFAKKLARSGKKLGQAAYERSLGDDAYKTHEKNARVLDKTAKREEAIGHYIRAEAARKSAAALRARGRNVRSSHYKQAERYELSAEKLNQKATAFASKKKVNVGKKAIDSILKESKLKGFERAKTTDEFYKEVQLSNELGSEGYALYNKLRGTGY